MQGTAQVDGMISEPFPIVNGVMQGCVLDPTLFGIYFSVRLREAKQTANLANPDVGLRPRFDANLFSGSRLKAKTRITMLHVRPSMQMLLPSALIPRNSCSLS